MNIIRYRNNLVSDEKLAAVRKKYDDTNDPSKYYKFKEWLHYANLNSWQRDSWHTNYSSLDEDGETYLVCTCGLEVIEDKLESVALSASKLPEELSSLSPLARVQHHVEFRDQTKLVCALITDFHWQADKNCYFWDAYCQACLDHVVNSDHSAALLFVETHNFLHSSTQ